MKRETLALAGAVFSWGVVLLIDKLCVFSEQCAKSGDYTRLVILVGLFAATVALFWYRAGQCEEDEAPKDKE
jgi:hypothetical protein